MWALKSITNWFGGTPRRTGNLISGVFNANGGTVQRWNWTELINPCQFEYITNTGKASAVRGKSYAKVGKLSWYLAMLTVCKGWIGHNVVTPRGNPHNLRWIWVRGRKWVYTQLRMLLRKFIYSYLWLMKCYVYICVFKLTPFLNKLRLPAHELLYASPWRSQHSTPPK